MKNPFVFFAFVFFPALCIGQTSSALNIKGIYVWDFKMASDGSQNQLTKDISDTYQSILSASLRNIKLVERRQLATIMAQRENEIVFQNGGTTIPPNVQKILTTNGANVVVLGEVTHAQSQGKYILNVKFVDIFSTQIIANPQQSLDEKKFDNKTTRDEFLKELIPPSLIGPIDIVRRTVLETNSEVWRYVQASYFEDFSYWENREGFRGDIWNKRDDKDHSCGIYSGRYLMKNKRNGFLKHKYFDRISKETRDFTLAHPMSVSLHMPDTLGCFGNSGCLGRGITTRFSQSQNCGYALTLTDDGELKFFRFTNIHDPKNIFPLYSTKVPVQKKQDIELGIISLKDEFFLYFNRKFMRVVKDNTYATGINGVVAFGKGTHWFDNITVFDQVRVN